MNTILITNQNKIVIDPTTLIVAGNSYSFKCEFENMWTATSLVICAKYKVNDNPSYTIFLDANNQFTTPVLYNSGVLKLCIEGYIVNTDMISITDYKSLFTNNINLSDIDNYLLKGKFNYCCLGNRAYSTDVYKLVIKENIL